LKGSLTHNNPSFGAENLDWLTMINQNWPNDASVGCKGRKNCSFIKFINVEDILMEDNEKLMFDNEFF
jgi:hypothetical protein